ncbi:MAG: formyltetrahydrofolate deformylase [Jatrophihabitans sp.]|uniref:formyltetrahydrofolate deformylase n=1 Tax=Jatrophihabitans sp. TaxID=1932789 RepID=UPI003F7F0FBD
MASVVLLLTCADQPGLVHAVADFVLGIGGNIVHAEQHIDPEAGVFFQRVEFTCAHPDVATIEAAFAPTAARFGMHAQVNRSDERPRIAVLASTQPHCLADLLARTSSGELAADIVAVISNHPDHAALAAFHGVPYHHLPVTRDTREQQERQVLEVLASAQVDLVVLARYMQILTPQVLDAYPTRIINIHHSFLPAFVGARPYHQAQQRGVKLIGATAHYATADLDEGPIIAQDVTAVSHRDAVDDLVRKGRDLEVVVLARAVRAHVEHRTLVFGNKTVVFG